MQLQRACTAHTRGAGVRCHAAARRQCKTDARSRDRALDAFDAHAQTCRGDVWTAVQMYSIAQPSHAIVI
jgi:hypothetical protein